eukprot:12507648-Alexandrium_andersonii.AAC.1
MPLWRSSLSCGPNAAASATMTKATGGRLRRTARRMSRCGTPKRVLAPIALPMRRWRSRTRGAASAWRLSGSTRR